MEGKKKYLGYSFDEAEAARKYDETAGPLGRPVNFPVDGQAGASKGVRGGTSNYKGVRWHSRDRKWIVQITTGGKQTHLGRFDEEEEAARKYDEFAAPLGRPLNFAGTHEIPCESIEAKKGRAQLKIRCFVLQFNNSPFDEVASDPSMNPQNALKIESKFDGEQLSLSASQSQSKRGVSDIYGGAAESPGGHISKRHVAV